MRPTIHLAQIVCSSDPSSPRCLACGAEMAPALALNRYGGRLQVAVCRNARDWETIYVGNTSYRRCVDAVDAQPEPRERFPEPTDPGFYWADWRVCEDGTHDEEHFVAGINGPPDVVEVWENSLDEEDPEHLLVSVAGVERSQRLDCFVWRSGKLERPR